jgi:ABC-type cobalamin/Fe3+-siderophores transport system ATPase subunit
MDNLKLEINNFGPINNVKLDIGKINVVGGVNGSGKSTVSKLLYCYLKSEIDDESLDYLMDSEDLSDLKNDEIIFKTDFTPSDIFYIDNLSILDLKDLDILRVDHIIHIKEALEDDTTQNSSDILSKIHNIIKSDCKKFTVFIWN